MIYLKILTKLRKYLLRKYQQICITRHTCLIKCKYLKNPYRSQFDFWHADSSLCEEQKYLKKFFSLEWGFWGHARSRSQQKITFLFL